MEGIITGKHAEIFSRIKEMQKIGDVMENTDIGLVVVWESIYHQRIYTIKAMVSGKWGRGRKSLAKDKEKWRMSYDKTCLEAEHSWLIVHDMWKFQLFSLHVHHLETIMHNS